MLSFGICYLNCAFPLVLLSRLYFLPLRLRQSLDYHTYRELSVSLEQLSSLSAESNRLVALFWLSQLPVRDERGNFIDVTLLKEV